MELLRLIENIRAPLWDTVFSAVSFLGDELFISIVIMAVYWCINKRSAYTLGMALFLSGLAVQSMKICFRIPRPWVLEPDFKPVAAAAEQATGYSFPSGHTQSSTAFFGSLGALTKHKPLKVFCFALPFLVAFSRMYLGVHTLTDVLASLVISFLFVFIAYKIMSDDSANKKRDLILALGMVAFAAIVIILASSLYIMGIIEARYLSDSLKASGAGLGFAVGFYIERNYICFSVKSKNILWQLLKLSCGAVGVLAIQEGIKLLAGTGLAIDTLRYFLVSIWVFALFPLLIKRFFEFRDDS